MELRRTFDILDFLRKNHGDKKDMLCAKREGSWVQFSVSEYYTNAKRFSLGLLAMGFQKGDKIVTATNNRPEWNFVDMGMAMIGVVHVPVYPTVSDEEYLYILTHSDARMVVVSDQSLYNRISALAKSVPAISWIYTFNSVDNAPNFEEVMNLGAREKARWNGQFHELRNSIVPSDIVSMIYTSGTTGQPKGVMLSHDNFMSNVDGVYNLFPLYATDRILSFLPLCHVFERMVNYLFQVRACSIYYAENLGTIQANLFEIQANAFVTVPRVIERIYDKLVATGESLSGIKRMLFFWAMGLGENFKANGDSNWWYSFRLGIARKLVFSKWQRAFGGNIRFIISGGAALQPRLSRLFFAADIPLMEGYGLTETSPVIAANHLTEPNCLKIGTVGPALKNLELKIDEDGEILVKGPSVMVGYYKDEQATAAAIDGQGWFHTGDIGHLEDGKFLKITDRKKEMFKLSSGKYIAPQGIENMLKESHFIEQAMVVGENEKFASALVLPNFEYLHVWAHDNKIQFRDNPELISLKKVMLQYQKEIVKLNKQLGKHEEIKRFRLVWENWNYTTGELSPTLKLKRRVLYKKYADVLREIYSYAPGEENRGSIKVNG
jgi:long-chain acyl-CoA synthetase